MVERNMALRLRRVEAGFTQQSFADRIGVSVDTVKKWERGLIVRPRASQLKAVSECLSVPIESLGFVLPDAQETVTPDRLLLPWTTEGTLAGVDLMCEAGSVLRRSFALLTGDTLTKPAFEWRQATEVDTVSSAVGAPINDEFVDDLDGLNSHLRLMDDKVGGGALLEVVQSQIRNVTAVLNERSYSERIGRRLHATVAELFRLAGWMSFDTGRHAQAQYYLITGLHAAHTAGDRALAANILGYMSHQAEEQDPARAVELAEVAASGYKVHDPRLRSMHYLRLSGAYACHRNTSAAQMAIDAAFDNYANTSPGHEGPGWSYWMNEAQLYGRTAGFSYLRLGQWQRAEAHLNHALQLQCSSFVRENAFFYIQLATAQLGQKNVEQACSTASQAIDLFGGDVKSAQCRVSLHRLANKVQPYRDHGHTRSFIDRVRQLPMLAV